MKKCPYCGHENDEQNELCERCLAQLRVEPEKPVKAKKKDKE